MYINRIILRDVRNFDALDLTLHNDWTDEHLQSVLITGPNGSGKTTLLRVIAGLWENLGNWLQLGRALNGDQLAQRDLLIDVGLAAIEICDLQPFPVWLFIAATPEGWHELKRLADNTEAQFVGEIRGARGRPQFEPKGQPKWFATLNAEKERLQVGVDNAKLLPNLLFLEAESRTIITPQKRGNREVHSEPLYQWYVTYEARDRWEGHIETMLRNQKIRDPQAFADIVSHVSAFLGEHKKITDFDDNLRLRVQLGSRKTNSHYIDDLSAGERQCLIQIFMVTRWVMHGGIVLIDEPDLHLHVSLQRYFIYEVEKVVKSKGGQLIITSHSPTLWEEFNRQQRIKLGEMIHERN